MNRRRLPREKLSTLRAGRGRRVLAGLARVIVALGLAAAIVAGAVAGWHKVRTGGQLRVKNVAFIGNERASNAELLALAGPLEGRNILAVDLAAAARGMERHPWVTHARVVRDLPDTLRVTVEERTAAALVSAGGLYVVDPNGIPFKPALATDQLDLPVISGVSRETLTNPDGSSNASVVTAIRLIQAYEKRNLSAREPLSEVRVVEEAGEPAYTLYCGDDALEVKLGVIRDSERETAAVLDRLERVWGKIDELERRGTHARSIDLGNRLRPDWVPARLEASADDNGNGSVKQ